MCEKYNGWTNRETWLVKLWIDNEQVTQEDALSLAKDARKRGASAMASAPAALLADDLEAYTANLIDEQTEDSNGEAFGACMANDLLQTALARVDWYEIAEAYLQDSDEL